jgi:hypothetical protein
LDYHEFICCYNNLQSGEAIRRGPQFAPHASIQVTRGGCSPLSAARRWTFEHETPHESAPALASEMKRLIYTAVFKGYDRVYPPVCAEPDVDYVIVTDDAGLNVSGWQTLYVDTDSFAAPKAANLYYKALLHRVLPAYDASLYVDGNIRILGPTRQLFEALEQSGSALMQYAHPLRSSVVEELEAVIAAGKVGDSARARKEFESYCNDGFPDTVRLGENGILLKNHRHPKLDDAMALWSVLFQKNLTRDQLSLPYVIWRTGLDVTLLPGTFRDPNPFFALYPHYSAPNIKPIYMHLTARSHDSFPHWALLRIWHARLSLRRAFRRLLGGKK